MYNFWRKKTQAVIRRFTPHVKRALPRKIKKQILTCMTPTNFLVKPVIIKHKNSPLDEPSENEDMDQQANAPKRRKRRITSEVPNTMVYQRTEHTPQQLEKGMLVQGALLHAGNRSLFFRFVV